MGQVLVLGFTRAISSAVSSNTRSGSLSSSGSRAKKQNWAGWASCLL